jgi:hypothetical protein
VILIKQESLANQDGSSNIHDYRIFYSLTKFVTCMLSEAMAL